MADVDVRIDHGRNEALLRRVRGDLLKDSATELMGHAMEEVPVDTGNLRRSHEVGGLDAGAQDIEVRATASYGIYVHEGTRYQSPNPWLRRAIDRMRV